MRMARISPPKIVTLKERITELLVRINIISMWGEEQLHRRAEREYILDCLDLVNIAVAKEFKQDEKNDAPQQAEIDRSLVYLRAQKQALNTERVRLSACCRLAVGLLPAYAACYAGAVWCRLCNV